MIGVAFLLQLLPRFNPIKKFSSANPAETMGLRWNLACLLFVSSSIAALHALRELRDDLHDVRPLNSAIFLSPGFTLKPGAVANKVYFDIPFPKGHIALKSFDAQVVDEFGVAVPLHETYLHHWVVEPYYGRKGNRDPPIETTHRREFDSKDYILLRNSGVCKRTLGQYFGLGSETRRTSTWIPDPYGIQVGNEEQTPQGFEQRWLLNVHAIDTRGAEDKLGCTECSCRLYNVTQDAFGRALPKDYVGGLHCCYDETQCRVRQGFQGSSRKLFLRYTVKWVNWDEDIVPVEIYIFDVTDTGIDDGKISSCKVEYQVEPCDSVARSNAECVDSKKVSVSIPHGGDIIYGVAHQHAGGVGSTLYGQDGRELCTSMPTYGSGNEAGNEEGYIVGMSTCYPKPGSIRVSDGEILALVSNYSSTRLHTGVMGLFYIMVAEPIHQTKSMRFRNLPIPLKDGAA